MHVSFCYFLPFLLLIFKPLKFRTRSLTTSSLPLLNFAITILIQPSWSSSPKTFFQARFRPEIRSSFTSTEPGYFIKGFVTSHASKSFATTSSGMSLAKSLCQCLCTEGSKTSGGMILPLESFPPRVRGITWWPLILLFCFGGFRSLI